MFILCSNGYPVRIRTAKNMDGSQLQDLGYLHFKPGVRYDICHTKSRRVRLVKVYRYGDDSCDMTFYSSVLQPIPGIGSILHLPEDPAIREVFTHSLNRMLNKAIYHVNRQHYRSDIFDFIPPPYHEEESDEEYDNIPDFFRHMREELPF